MRERFEKLSGRVVRPHRYEWLWEPLAAEPTAVLRPMFGGKAAYLDGKLMLYFAAKAEPWRGVLVCTEREHHAALRAEFPELAPHPVLPKWLYLPESADSFERAATRLVRYALQRDPRLGVLPKPKRKRASGRGLSTCDSGRVEGPSPDGPRPVRRRALQKDRTLPAAAVSSKKRRT